MFKKSVMKKAVVCRSRGYHMFCCWVLLHSFVWDGQTWKTRAGRKKSLGVKISLYL